MYPHASRSVVTGSRRRVLLYLAIAGVVCAWYLKLTPGDLVSAKGWKIAGDFFSAALHPALRYEDGPVPDDWEPLLVKAGRAMARTFQYAVASISLALVGGIVLGFLGSRRWWPEWARSGFGRGVFHTLYAVSRAVMAFTRSIHELIWGLLFITALGMSPEAGIVAIAIPYGGTLGKIFSEILDEQSARPAEALRGIGSGSIAAFLFGTVTGALPDLLTYTLYRFECALRSSAILGFVGIETIGYYIRVAGDELHWREVWTYLYVLILVMIVVDRWGAAVRRRLAPHASATCTR